MHVDMPHPSLNTDFLKVFLPFNSKTFHDSYFKNINKCIVL